MINLKQAVLASLALIAIMSPTRPRIAFGRVLFAQGRLALRDAESQDRAPEQAKPDQESKSGKSLSNRPLPRGKKLVLADGTFQLVREYSVEGDRVRYWSVERSAWEEIPTNMVNWDATHEAEADQSKQEADLKAKLRASELAERTKDINVDRSFEVKPGLFLPDGVGFYALQETLIFEMKQSITTSKISKGREIGKILSGVPMIPSKQNLELPGAHAATRLTTAEPEFYMRPADRREPKFTLVRAQISGGHRVLETTNTYLSGEQTHKTQDVDFQTWTPADGLFRYTPGQHLEPGEYAFLETTSEGINEYVWDFGIDLPGAKKTK